MKKGVHLFIVLCIGMALFGCNTPQPIGEIATYLEDLATEDRFSGAVLIAKDGKSIFEESYGLANRDFGVSNQIDTKFNLGSMNKMFTAVAILQLVEQEKLSVDDNIIKHLPDYPNQEVVGKVTIHHLLTHTSGLGDFFTEEFFETSKDRFKALEDYLPLFVDKPTRFEPGAQFFYSNAGYIVLGLVIEEITAQSYFDYVRESIFQPCGMTNTDSYELDDVVPNLAVGYSTRISDDGKVKENQFLIPIKGSSAGGGYSTVEDLLNFSNCLMNYQILSPELTELLLEGKVKTPDLGEGSKYGYGFQDRLINNHRIVGHGGGASGICANLDIFIDLEYTVVILSNSDADCRRVRIYVRETLLE